MSTRLKLEKKSEKLKVYVNRTDSSMHSSAIYILHIFRQGEEGVIIVLFSDLWKKIGTSNFDGDLKVVKS